MIMKGAAHWPINRLSFFFPDSCNTSATAMALIADHKNVSEGRMAVLSSIVRATTPSECFCAS